MYFNFKQSKKYDFTKIKYIEVDLPSVITNKIKIYKHNKDVYDIINSDGKATIDDKLT